MENNDKPKSKDGRQDITDKSKPTENAITRRYIYSGALWILGGFILIGVALY